MTFISIREVGPRDGLQNEDPVPTAAKVRAGRRAVRHGRTADRGGVVRAPEGGPADGRRRRGVGGRTRGTRGPVLRAGTQRARRPARARRRVHRDRGRGLGQRHAQPPQHQPLDGRVAGRDRRADRAGARRRRDGRGDRGDQLRLPVRGGRRPEAGCRDRRAGDRRRRRPGRVRGHHGHGHPAPGRRAARRGAPGPATAAALPRHAGYRPGQRPHRARPRGHRVRRERRRAGWLPVRAGGERQRGHRGGRAHAARHGHRDRDRPGAR